MLSKDRGVFVRLARGCVWPVALLLLGTPAAFPQGKLESPQDTNDRIRKLAAAAQVKQGDYLIGSGDLLQVQVFDVPELSREVRVTESGFVSLPLLPVKVRAAGLTSFQLEEKLAELLQANGLVSHPQVTVFVKDQRSAPITIIGAVGHPTVLQGVRPISLLEAVSEAGGIANDAGSTVIITRAMPQPASDAEKGRAGNGSGDGSAESAQPTTITINLNDLLETGDSRFNIPVMGGDVISVPRAGIVYVVGAVDRPGGFVLANDREQMTTLKILALAGGFKPTANVNHAVILRKNPETGQTKELGVDLKKVLDRKAEDVRLLPSDILFVPDSSGKRALRRTGEIALSLVSGAALFRLARP